MDLCCLDCYVNQQFSRKLLLKALCRSNFACFTEVFHCWVLSGLLLLLLLLLVVVIVCFVCVQIFLQSTLVVYCPQKKKSCYRVGDSVGQSWRSHALKALWSAKCRLQVESRELPAFLTGAELADLMHAVKEEAASSPLSVSPCLGFQGRGCGCSVHVLHPWPGIWVAPLHPCMCM